MTSICPSCGARVSEGQSTCDLCGTSLNQADASQAPDARDEQEGFGDTGVVECPVCGSDNPDGSRFCNQCGSKMQEVRSAGSLADLPAGGSSASSDVEESSASSSDRAGDGMAKRVLYTVGAGMLLMMVLYGITLLSEGQSQSSTDTSQATVSPESPSQEQEAGGSSASSESVPETSSSEPLPSDVAEDAESLKESIAAASDSDEQIELRQKLVRLYVRAERQDLAGNVQEKIAETEQTAMAWADAGNLYYDWMMQQQSRPQQTEYAKEAIEAYQKSLNIDPTNLDVRTDMAVAYLYDPDNPMQAIQETKKVLEEDPDHIQANFNRGIMLLRINRVEEAVKQFERVKNLAESGSPVYERTEQVLQRIRQQR